MYSNVYNVRLWRTSWFCFMPSPSCTLLLSSDVSHKHKPAFFMFCFLLFCWARGLCILSKCAVCKNLCYYEWAFVWFSCSTERVEWFSAKHRNQKKKENKAETEMIHRVVEKRVAKIRLVKRLATKSTILSIRLKSFKKINNFSKEDKVNLHEFCSNK